MQRAVTGGGDEPGVAGLELQGRPHVGWHWWLAFRMSGVTPVNQSDREARTLTSGNTSTT